MVEQSLKKAPGALRKLMYPDRLTSAAKAGNGWQVTAGINVFSFMTSFTQCSETSFTLPPERSEGGSKSALSKEGKDGLGNERYW
jgi:hypothetical protein